jgi:hypothetical protein
MLRTQTMKTKTSSYVLAAEILTIILFHAVKINQAEKHTADIAFSHPVKTITLPKQGITGKSGFDYMLVSLIK